MAANAVLQPVREEGWRSGFANLLRKELGLWWATRRWWKTALLWLLILNGMVAMVVLAAKSEPAAAEGQGFLQLALSVFFQMGAMGTAIAGTIMTQDAIIGEKQLGTAAWILSKPVSRQAFVLAKALAHAVGMISLSLVVPALVLLPEVQYLTGSMPSLLLYAGGVGMLALHLLFYQAMALMLGTLFQARGGVIGIGLGFLFAGQAASSFARWTQYVTPWLLGNLSGAYVAGAPVPAWTPAPVVATAVMVPVFLAIALWRFNREEL